MLERLPWSSLYLNSSSMTLLYTKSVESNLSVFSSVLTVKFHTQTTNVDDNNNADRDTMVITIHRLFFFKTIDDLKTKTEWGPLDGNYT